MKKRILSALLCIGFTIAIFGCANSQLQTIDSSSNTTPVPTTDVVMEPYIMERQPISTNGGIDFVSLGQSYDEIKDDSYVTNGDVQCSYMYKNVFYGVDKTSNLIECVKIFGTLEEVDEYTFTVKGTAYETVRDLSRRFGNDDKQFDFYYMGDDFILHTYCDNIYDKKSRAEVCMYDKYAISPEYLNQLLIYNKVNTIDTTAITLLGKISNALDDDEFIVNMDLGQDNVIEVITNKNTIFDVIIDETGSFQQLEVCTCEDAQ